jgi:hypothetical protein
MSIVELQQDDEDVEYSDITQSDETVQQIEEPVVEEDDLPEKYRGKSAKEIAKMHSEAEKLIGRQAGEVGELRKLTDQILKQQLENNSRKEPEEDIDIFTDPDKYISKRLENHPDIQSAKQLKAELAQQSIVGKLNEAHPGYQEIVSSEAFAEWVKASKVRTKLYADAHHNFDFDSADELLTTLKALNNVKKQQGEEQVQQLQQNRAKQLKAAGVDAGGSGEVSKKVFRRADLIQLKMKDPARYDMLSEEIMLAYQEGRVK